MSIEFLLLAVLVILMTAFLFLEAWFRTRFVLATLIFFGGAGVAIGLLILFIEAQP